MTKKYLQQIPRTLQEDFVDNNVIPFVGAGFSKNAVIPQGAKMLDWTELGRKVSEYISEYQYNNPIDALSLFESEFSRVKLIELLAKFLLVHEIKPGDAHRSFCNVFFDTICTTNFDFLLEHTLQESKRPHSIIVSEDRLPINTHEKTKIIKLHGDFNHPEKMVITENDYDSFLQKNKILSTYISNFFITRTLFLIGYSFDDVDIRGLWQIINSRLGQLRRPAYTVMVDADPIEISRFERRNIKVINLKGRKADYPSILNHFFIEIKEMIDEKSPARITVTNEKAREEMILPNNNKRLCFISAPTSRISFLKELIYPVLIENSIAPISLDEVIMPGDNWMAKSETLLKECSLAIVDASGNSANVMWELGVILSLNKNVILIVSNEDLQNGIPYAINNYRFFVYNASGDNEGFISDISNELLRLSEDMIQRDDTEPNRLLKKSEYDAAVIAAFRLLELTLRESSLIDKISASRQPYSLSLMLKSLYSTRISDTLINKVISFLYVRNQVVHANASIEKKTATEIVRTVNELNKNIKEFQTVI